MLWLLMGLTSAVLGRPIQIDLRGDLAPTTTAASTTPLLDYYDNYIELYFDYDYENLNCDTYGDLYDSYLYDLF